MPTSGPVSGVETLPSNTDGLIAAFYGDDFTGSTDVMEAWVRSGHECVLFLDVPTEDEVVAAGTIDVIGVAGLSRSWSPEEMDQWLPAIFHGLSLLGAPLFHYKICSTFDSAPEVGNIGKALEIARDIFGTHAIPLIVGAPILKRYTAFGNLFATADGVTHRIDRHPTMAHHPVTPMKESDLRVHLSYQTALSGALIDVLALTQHPSAVDTAVDQVFAADPGYVLFDVWDEATLKETGRQLLRLVGMRLAGGEKTTVVCGSSGVEYALAQSLAVAGEPGLVAPTDYADPAAKPTLVVVGSRSPVTAVQAQVALDHGFVEVPVDPAHFLADSADVATYRAAIVREVVVALKSGANTIVTTPAKSDDVPIDGTTLGQELSQVVREVCEHSLPQRLVVAGGDTSGHIARGIGVTSLRVKCLMAPGAPLCHAEILGDTPRSLELCLKGGQVGPPDYFVRLAGARTSRATTKERAQL